MSIPANATIRTFQLTTSRRGRLVDIDGLPILDTFQLTTSRRGRRRYAAVWYRRKRFQLTTSRRGRRRSLSRLLLRFLNFNSLPHAEVDGLENNDGGNTMIFQLTTSRRGRRCLHNTLAVLFVHFNSLPHAEVDNRNLSKMRSVRISTHYLTQR